ncbi:MAG: hypothetical protein QXY20_09450 [Thermofilum sp.]|uniref:hypothetical protein n=1 Tax=Thermofilum sp. TaxID=1961369 RepID=UPI00315FF83D
MPGFSYRAGACIDAVGDCIIQSYAWNYPTDTLRKHLLRAIVPAPTGGRYNLGAITDIGLVDSAGGVRDVFSVSRGTWSIDYSTSKAELTMRVTPSSSYNVTGLYVYSNGNLYFAPTLSESVSVVAGAPYVVRFSFYATQTWLYPSQSIPLSFDYTDFLNRMLDRLVYGVSEQYDPQISIDKVAFISSTGSTLLSGSMAVNTYDEQVSYYAVVVFGPAGFTASGTLTSVRLLYSTAVAGTGVLVYAYLATPISVTTSDTGMFQLQVST